VAEQIYQHVFPSGLTLLAERMEHVRSAAFNFLVPAGYIHDPPDKQGIASVLAELMTRGAGSRDSREITLALDNLGLDRSETPGAYNTHFSGATVSSNLHPALEIYADIIRRPHLPEEDLKAVKALALQDLKALEDEPRSRVMVELRRHLYPTPLSYDSRGTEATVSSLSLADVKRHFQRLFRPKGTILAVSGNIAWEPLRDLVGKLFGDWKGGEEPAIAYGPTPTRRGHLDRQVEQTQITVGYPSVPFGHPEYYNALGAVNVLSGGNMSSRLFTEIREKEGLCYSVWATYQTFRDRGTVLSYAGTRNEYAQRTLDLLLRELKRLKEGIDEDEVLRVRAGLKSSQIMAQESTGRRAATLASDWFYLGRVRSFDEVRAAIDALTPASILEHVRRYPAQDFTIVTLGPKALEIKEDL
jgi:predicted Zn-dependent peptidase